MTSIEQFQHDWQDRGYEKGESQQFWLDLLANVFGIQDLAHFIQFENQVHLDHTSFIDGYIPSTKVLIEQKGRDKDLNKPIIQSDGSYLTAFQQAKRYAAELPYSQRPRWIVTCNFRSWCIYDMEQPNSEPQTVFLENLHKEVYRLQFLVQQENIHLNREMEVSMKAGEIIGHIYDKLLALYINPDSPETLHSLNMLCVRLVFCLYAEDAGIFGRKQLFGDYISQFPAKQIRQALLQLFEVLDTPVDQRDPYLDDDLKAFPYVNGGLFTVQDKQIPQFTDELKELLIRQASDDFDWSEISPTIFGAIFESTLNPETRRAGGMHYTSIENIHKVIDPLFLNDLNAELEHIFTLPVKQQKTALVAFQDRLASLRFLDPACGSGNFLTETYLSLRRLENRCLQALLQDQAVFDFFGDRVKVNIHQFYGIEINDFAATVAKTALWIAESQMLHETSRILARDLDFLPLKSYSNIVEGNALTIDWNTVCPPDQLSYIIGNPPFVGYALQSKEQKNDLISLGEDLGKNIDYVAGWYFKAAKMMQETHIQAAFVSTNSITQGEQVAAIWKPLKEKYNVQINFAYRTFRWDSEASLKAHVHCVIVGFSCDNNNQKKYIYNGQQVVEAQNINGYLLNAHNIFIERLSSPMCPVPELVRGCQPTDDGNLILTREEKEELLRKEPQAEPLIRPFMMGKDFIERRPRYCLWLVNANPTLLRQCPQVMQRIANVREFRLKSTKAATRQKADTPTLFDEIRDCKSDYVAIPVVSSEGRRYIPIDYLSTNIIPGNKLFTMQNATLYHFGILTSNVHMAWMRAVCGRLKSDYSYSNTIVYNNFPWPEVGDMTAGATTAGEAPASPVVAEIERTAQAILDARAEYPDSSLADLYDEVTMPVNLRRAHQANDRAVLRAYGFPANITEPDCVAALFARYEQMTK